MERLLGVLTLSLVSLAGLTSAASNPVIDISHWNRNPDYRSLKAEGIAGIIHKATQGVTYVDDKYTDRRQLALKEGLLWGAYHFGVGGRSGSQQANHFLRTVGDTSKTLIALDLEVNNGGKSMSLAEAEEFVRTVKEKTGRYPLLYGGPAYLDQIGASTSSVLKECTLWISHYTNAASPRLPKGWSSWALWQYTDGRTGGEPKTVRGIGIVDRDRYVGTVDQLKSKWPKL